MKMVLNLQDFILMRLFNWISLVKAGVLKAAQFKREKGNGPLNHLRGLGAAADALRRIEAGFGASFAVGTPYFIVLSFVGKSHRRMLVTEGSGGSGLSLRYEDLDSVGPRTTFGNWLWTIEASTFEVQLAN
jgi:hypothetical protein